VHLALAKPHGTKDDWLIVSDEPTHVTTFDDYGLRFDIEENFLDDKSGGFRVESSLIRSADALSRLFLVLAVATLFLVCQGTAVVESGKRRWVDAHWYRGNSYLKIGWKWLRRAFVKGYALISQLKLSPLDDPEPAMASRKQAKERDELTLSVKFEVVGDNSHIRSNIIYKTWPISPNKLSCDLNINHKMEKSTSCLLLYSMPANHSSIVSKRSSRKSRNQRLLPSPSAL
jgi:hypothetical protein